MAVNRKTRRESHSSGFETLNWCSGSTKNPSKVRNANREAKMAGPHGVEYPTSTALGLGNASMRAKRRHSEAGRGGWRRGGGWWR
jgi:hypothetical protein